VVGGIVLRWQRAAEGGLQVERRVEGSSRVM